MNKNQQIKKKVRDSAEWKQLRIDIADEYEHKDALTNRKLLKGWNCHHMDMNVMNYDNLAMDRFLPLNKSSHDLVHVLYRYYSKDSTILDRLELILQRMVELNEVKDDGKASKKKRKSK